MNREERLASWKAAHDEYKRQDIQDLFMVMYIVGAVVTILWHYWI